MTKALIIGGGIAGTVTAIALRRAGVRATVHEAYGRTSDGVGAFLTLAVNGIDALDALGLRTLLRGRTFDTPRMEFFNGNGRALGGLPVGGELPDGSGAVTVSRSDLYIALRDEAVRQGVQVEYGKRLTGARREGEGVRAEFADGSSATGDLLIGADGLRSTVRYLIDPAAPKATYQGLLNTVGTARGVDLGLRPGTVNMVFGKRSFFAYFPHPDGDTWWWANPPAPKEPTAADLAAATDAEIKARLLGMFSADRTPATRLIEASEDIVRPYPTYYFPRVPVWHRDRMIIVGDAAHATPPAAGQGASMALEDAVTLAKCLRDNEDVDLAFGRYESVRRERVEAIVAMGERNGGGKKSPGTVGRVLRDVFLARRFRALAASGVDPGRWAWDHHLDWESPVPA
ncbi:FAD-dependent oxidoreductase [Amycolatopsis antarctica]|uniref:FAD-dependent oxidoreductase n=1 Tax=Amycolatopsis antarctica TaxID=1854586 RepID=A0A263D3U9_9PSEU|nr:NAD(P)/FAD-dependent oxidoreductase [Amycolatopsis antarctica]OZM72758.1 FAD-dependent oxidoreductase [Amycolatopsis antarctica]